MSTYNGSLYLRQQIDSILVQEGVNLNLYIRDDGSTDDTVTIIREYCERDSRVHFKGSASLGVGISFMTLLALPVESDYYAFSDQDDYWYPDKLIRAIRKMEEAEGLYKLYAANQNCVNSKGVYQYTRFSETYKVPSLISNVISNDIAGCTMVLNKSLRDIIIDRLPPMDFFNLKIHDSWIMPVALAAGTVIFDPIPCMDFRRHENTFSEASISGMNLISKYQGKLKRFKKNGLRRRNATKFSARFLFNYYNEFLSNEEGCILNIISTYNLNIGCKIKLLFNRDVNQSIRSDKLLYYIKIIFNIL